MALNKKSLQNLFGADDSIDEPIMDIDESSENNSDDFTDIDISQDDDNGLPPAPILKNPDALPVSNKQVTSDIDFALRAQADLLNRQQQLIQVALENAMNGNSRDVEAATNAISAASSLAEKLISLHEKIQKMKSSSEGEQQQQQIVTGNTINQIIYQGTTSDIIDKITNGTIDVNNL